MKGVDSSGPAIHQSNDFVPTRSALHIRSCLGCIRTNGCNLKHIYKGNISLLAAGFFSKGHQVIANANGVGREENKATQGGMAECSRVGKKAAPMSRPILL